LTDDEYDDWVTVERRRVKAYLEGQGISSPNIEWPAFDVAPHFAVWAVESKSHPGKLGWWAFSGDMPTDYVSEDGNCHPRNALKLLVERWRAYISALNAGSQPEGVTLETGSGASLAVLGDLLEKRVALLVSWLQDDELWKDL
jgi:hypothetical protein